MTIEIRTIEPDELEDFLATTEASFGESLRAGELHRIQRVLDPARAIAAFDDEARIGTTAAYSFSLSVPGGEAAAAGVTMVGVLPSHRRKGVLSRMMRHQLDDVHERGEPVAILWASEGSIYHRFGYGIASLQGWIDIERDRAIFRDRSEPLGRARIVGVQEAGKVVPAVYDEVRRATPGMLARSAAWWEAMRFSDPEHDRDGFGPKFWVAWENEGRAEAYACYRLRHDWPQGYARGTTEVLEAMAVSPLATREIWRFLFGVDLAERVVARWLPLDHPLLFTLTEPRRLRFALKDGLWLRVVDVARALEARRYAADGDVTFEIADAFCPWNAGRWRLEVAEGAARAERTTASPEVACDVQDLGAAYLGGVSFGQLETAGRVHELSPGSLQRADSIFRWDRAPWCPEIF